MIYLICYTMISVSFAATLGTTTIEVSKSSRLFLTSPPNFITLDTSSRHYSNH